jgi:hypothetical protein
MIAIEEVLLIRWALSRILQSVNQFSVCNLQFAISV